MKSHIKLFTPQEIARLKQFSQQNKSVFVGLSGGVDSVVLLDTIHKLNQTFAPDEQLLLCAVHVHHGLSDNAEAWLKFCAEFCQQRQIKFEFKKVKLAKQSRQSLEALARDARYSVFKQVAGKNAVVVTAQHLNDQAETFFLRLKRGSGPNGLASMSPLSDLTQDIELWRPLLGVSKLEILDYAKANNLDWVEDESNLNDDFDRNFLRNQILPELEARWPGFSQCVARSAELCRQENQIIEEVAAADFNAAVVSFSNLARVQPMFTSQVLDISLIQNLSYARQNSLLRFWLNKNNELMPSQKIMQQILDNFACSEDQQPKIKLKLGEIRQYKTRLFYLTQTEIDAFEQQAEPLSWNGEAEVELNTGTKLHIANLGIALPTANQTAQIRFKPSLSTKCYPKYRNCRKTLKQLLQEYEVPPWMRNQVAYLFYDDELISALGLWVCEPPIN